MNKDLFKVYVFSKNKNGIVTKSDHFLERAFNMEEAEIRARNTAKLYGFRSKVIISSIFKMVENKQWQKVK